jgi:general secretion pathway protein L
MRQLSLSIRPAFTAFLTWWLSELAAMVPPRLLHQIRRRRERIVIAFTGANLIIRRWGADAVSEIGRVALRGPDEGEQRAVVEDMLARAGVRGKPATVLLTPDQALRKTLSLPAAAEENLGEVLRFEMDRQTPFRSQDIHFDYRVSARHPGAKRIDVDLVVVPRVVVDQIIERCSRLGIAPHVIGVAAHEREDPNTFNLLPRSRFAADGRWGRRLALVLGLAALALFAATLHVPLERQRSLAADLAAEAEAARSEAESARQLREQIDQAIEQGRLIVLKKMERPSVVQLLDEITRLLDDETWLIRLRFFGDEVQAFGYSGAASMLISTIEDSPLFRDAEFRAPITRDPGVEAERFHVGFQLALPSPRLASAINPEEHGREP